MAGVVGMVAVFLVHNYISTRTSNSDQTLRPDRGGGGGYRPGDGPGRAVGAGRDLAPGDYPSQGHDQPQSGGRPGGPDLNIQRRAHTLHKLAPEGTAAGLGGLLDPNSLAVTVKTDEVSGVAGFINPGDRIDVLVAIEQGRSERRGIFQNNPAKHQGPQQRTGLGPDCG